MLKIFYILFLLNLLSSSLHASDSDIDGVASNPQETGEEIDLVRFLDKEDQASLSEIFSLPENTAIAEDDQIFFNLFFNLADLVIDAEGQFARKNISYITTLRAAEKGLLSGAGIDAIPLFSALLQKGIGFSEILALVQESMRYENRLYPILFLLKDLLNTAKTTNSSKACQIYSLASEAAHRAMTIPKATPEALNIFIHLCRENFGFGHALEAGLIGLKVAVTRSKAEELLKIVFTAAPTFFNKKNKHRTLLEIINTLMTTESGKLLILDAMIFNLKRGETFGDDELSTANKICYDSENLSEAFHRQARGRALLLFTLLFQNEKIINSQQLLQISYKNQLNILATARAGMNEPQLCILSLHLYSALVDQNFVGAGNAAAIAAQIETKQPEVRAAVLHLYLSLIERGKRTVFESAANAAHEGMQVPETKEVSLRIFRLLAEQEFISEYAFPAALQGSACALVQEEALHLSTILIKRGIGHQEFCGAAHSGMKERKSRGYALGLFPALVEKGLLTGLAIEAARIGVKAREVQNKKKAFLIYRELVIKNLAGTEAVKAVYYALQTHHSLPLLELLEALVLKELIDRNTVIAAAKLGLLKSETAKFSFKLLETLVKLGSESLREFVADLAKEDSLFRKYGRVDLPLFEKEFTSQFRQPHLSHFRERMGSTFDAKNTDAMIVDLLEHGEIPLPKLKADERIFWEVANKDLLGAFSELIAFIGIENLQSKKRRTYFVLKVPESTHSREEAFWINKAYEDCRFPLIRAVVTETSEKVRPYKLRFAWHEEIFRSGCRHFELLHSAPGMSLQNFYREFGSLNLDLNLDGSISGANKFLDESKWDLIQEAYEAWGATLGSFFTVNDLPLGHEGLDCHYKNIFYDSKSKTITMIDLEALGMCQNGSKFMSALRSLSYALPQYAITVAVKVPFDSNHSMADFTAFTELAEQYSRLINDHILVRNQRLKEAFARAFSQNYKLLPQFTVYKKIMEMMSTAKPD